MRIFNHDISLKKAAVYAAVAAKLFGRTNCPDDASPKREAGIQRYKRICRFCCLFRR